MARIRWTASMVASVPELAKRHSGTPKRRASSSATTMASEVGWAKWVPLATRSLTAATTAGWAWPTAMTPKPPCRSTYSLPSASQTREPRPWLIQTAWGREICQLEVTPPASDPAARSSRSREPGWRSRNRCSWTAISSSRRVPTDIGTVMTLLSGQPGDTTLGQLVGDDRPLDLRGALPDPVHPQLPVEALGDVLAHVAAAPEDLHRPVGDPPGHLGGVQLGHRALGVLDLDVEVVVDAVGGLVGHQPGRPQLGHGVGQHELDRLVAEDGLAVGVAFAGEGGRLLDQPLGRPQRPGRDHQALVAEPLVDKAHAVALGADQLAGGDTDVLEGDHRVVVGVGVAVGGGPHHPDAGAVDVEHEQGVGAGVGPAGQLALEEHVVGVVEGGHVPLDPVEQVVVAVAGGRGLDGVDVGAGALLGDGIALAALTADGGRHPAVQLLLAGHLGQPGG